MKTKWTEFYKKYGRFYLKTHPFFDRIASRFDTYKVKSILDLGCGSGRHTIALAQKGFNVVGVDFSPSAVQLTRNWLNQKGLYAEIIIADFNKHISGLADESFDAVIAVSSLEYSNENQLNSTIVEVNRVLKEGGLFWMVIPSKDTPVNKIVEEYVFYDVDKIKEMLSSSFRLLEFSQDQDKSYSILAQEK